MSKRVYISADYAPNDGDRSVIDELHKWGNDNLHKVDYCDTAQVASGSVSNNSNCRPCDLKLEFNRQINASSAVIFVIGDKTYRLQHSVRVRHISRMPTALLIAKYITSQQPQVQMTMSVKSIRIPTLNMNSDRLRRKKGPS